MLTLAGVLGFPVGHSRSPQMMAAAFTVLGLDWRYLRLPVPPETFAPTARALPASGYVGANVTIPHKVAAHELADELTPAAAAIGAVNTLTFGDESIEGDNTDAGGLLDALGSIPSGRGLVLGAGGAARAVVWALRESGMEVAVWNRTAERARSLGDEFGVAVAERPGPAEVIVNTTSVGLEAGADPVRELGLEGVDPPPVLCDLVYGNEPTALCRWAEAGGSRVVDGIEVLVRQGARSLRRWTGREAPVDAMRHAARG